MLRRQYEPLDLLRASQMHIDAVRRVDPNWVAVLEQAAAEKALEQGIEKPHYVEEINQICDENGFEPEGAILGSTYKLRLNGALDADHHVAFRLLKEMGRIQQIDRGRGRALVVWSDLPVRIEDLEDVDPKPWWSCPATEFVMRPVTEEERIALGLPVWPRPRMQEGEASSS